MKNSNNTTVWYSHLLILQPFSYAHSAFISMPQFKTFLKWRKQQQKIGTQQNKKRTANVSNAKKRKEHTNLNQLTCIGVDMRCHSTNLDCLSYLFVRCVASRVSLAFFGILYCEYSYCWCWRCCCCLLEKLIPNEVRQESPYLVWRWINRYKLRCEWKRFGMWYKTVFATFLRVLFAFDAHTQSLANSITCKTMNIHDFWSSILNTWGETR